MFKTIKVFFCFVSVLIASVIFCPVLKAETPAEPEAVNNTVAQAEEKVQPQSDDQFGEGIEYRQKLGHVVTPQAEGKQIVHELDSYVRYSPTRSLKSQPGKISIIKSVSEYSYSFKLFDQIPIELAFGGADVNINANDAVPVSLPTHLTEVAFGAEATLPLFFDKTYIRFGITPGFYSSNWNFKANSFNFGSHVLAIYQPNEKLTLIAGIAVSPGFEDPITPFGGLIYEPNDRLSFELVPSRPTISYKINDMITVFGEGGFYGAEFKVSKDGLKGAALAYNEVHVGGGVKVSVNNYIDAYLSCGRMFNHYLKYRDSLGKVNMKNNTYSEFRVEVKI